MTEKKETDDRGCEKHPHSALTPDHMKDSNTE